jgi:hypothetical protein
MKTTIDLTDTRVQYVMDLILKRADFGYPAAAKLQAAVLPVFLEPGGRRTPVQVGSCVVVAIEEETFAFSAAHVFDDFDTSPIQVGCGKQLIYLSGERYSSAPGESGSHRDDPVDASVLRIQGHVPDVLRSRALSLDNLDPNPPSDSRYIQFALGYRTSQSRTTGRVLSAQLDLIPSFEFDGGVYQALGMDRVRFTASAYDDEVPRDGKWQTSPRPKGMSGGAILDIQGLPADLRLPPRETLDAKLCSIVTEWRPPIDGTPSVLVGSRIGHHLNLIQQLLPGLVLGAAARRLA